MNATATLSPDSDCLPFEEVKSLLSIFSANLNTDTFDWHAHHVAKFESFTETERHWREIAHSAELVGDKDVVMFAVTNALENEMLAREAAQQAKFHKPR